MGAETRGGLTVAARGSSLRSLPAQSPAPPPPGRATPAAASAARHHPEHPAGTCLGLGAEKPLRVGDGFDYGLAVQVELRVGPAIGPIQHRLLLPVVRNLHFPPSSRPIGFDK